MSKLLVRNLRIVDTHYCDNLELRIISKNTYSKNTDKIIELISGTWQNEFCFF